MPLGEVICERVSIQKDRKSTVHGHVASNIRRHQQADLKTNMKRSNNFMSCIFPTSYSGLVTLPCHGLVDTGAQDGVIGLWHFLRWCACLAQQHGLRPVFEEIPSNLIAGGIGGSAKTLGIAEVPVGQPGPGSAVRVGLSSWKTPVRKTLPRP